MINHLSTSPDQPFGTMLIAGPCSAESPEQLHRIADGLKGLPLAYFRAGLWKPRTRPGHYEGVGSLGLAWLQDIQQRFGMKVTTEVATADQAHSALHHGIDALWVGARTTVNPFYVQEIAEVCRGVDIPIFVKNPINPDLKLWMGAIERFQAVETGEVHAIHRGFSTFHSTGFRNPPRWTLPIQLKQKIPSIKLLCDPSHIAGNRSMIDEICQQAIDLCYDGFMIETHHDPDHAWTDADQQITPDHLKSLIARLTYRKAAEDVSHRMAALMELRDEIDQIDRAILEHFSHRHELSAAIGRLKAEHDMTVLQPERWQQVLLQAHAIGTQRGLNSRFIDALFQIVHEGSIETQLSALRRDHFTTAGSTASESTSLHEH